MHRHFNVVGYFGLVLIAGVLDAHAARLTISVYNDAGVPSNVLNHAEERGTGIFSRAGLDLTWINCSRPRTDKQGCARIEGSEHLVIRIIPHMVGADIDGKFGLSFLGAGGFGRYCDVFWDKIQELGTDKVEEWAVLGSVMAHEIGHLILGSHSHAISGIMRAQWDQKELQRIGMGTLLFLPEEEKQMKARYSSRLMQGPSASAWTSPRQLIGPSGSCAQARLR
jgi:hypothetical protein